MQFHNLPDLWEETTTKNPPVTTDNPIGKRLEPIEFKIKPDGEFNFKGVPDSDVIRQIITTTDYHRDQNRDQESEILKQAKNIDMMTFGVLASSILISFLCLFLSFNNKQQTQGSVVNNGQFLRGTYCQ